MQIVQEGENLYRLTHFGLVNCFLVREDGGGTLVDANVGGSAGPIFGCRKRWDYPLRESC